MLDDPEIMSKKIESGTFVPKGDEALDAVGHVPLYLLRLALDGASPTLEDRNALEDFLSLRVQSYARTDPNEALFPSDHLGYLQGTVNGRTMFVPFHLAQHFPKDDILMETERVSRQIALSPDNPICVSGSTTFIAALDEIGDLDFCEYHLAEAEAIAPAVVARSKNMPPFPLVEVKCAGGKHFAPWASLCELGETLCPQPPVDPVHKVKLDFASSSSLGLLPATSWLLPLGSDREEGNARDSFVYQEAVFSADPPRALYRPEELLRYLAWLLEQAKSKLAVDGNVHKDAPKALKRLVSLLLLLDLHDLANEALSGINHPALGALVRRERMNELEAMCESLTGENRVWLQSAIEAQPDGEEFSDDALNEAAQIALEIGQALLEDIEMRLDQAGGQA